jgi:hypothetical protein
MQPQFNRIEAGLPRMKVSLQLHTTHQLLNHRILHIITNRFKFKVNLYKYCSNDKLNSLSRFTVEGNSHSTTHVAEVDTMFSPKPGIISEGYCQPGTDPTPRTRQMEQKMAMQDYPWGSQRSYLKNSLARLSILILSKAYPGLGYTLPITRLMKA